MATTSKITRPASNSSYINSLLGNTKWGSPATAGVTVDYSFMSLNSRLHEA